MRKRQLLLFSILNAGGLFYVPTPAFADGIDLVPFLLRGARHNLLFGIALVFLLMVINYLLNLLVIGWPVVKFGKKPLSRVAWGMVGFTLLGQVADRVGALAAILVAQPIANIMNLQGEAPWAIPLIVANCVFTGICIAALTLYFLRRRWDVRGGFSFLIVLAASVFTNPTILYFIVTFIPPAFIPWA